jgi:hypothetical protein
MTITNNIHDEFRRKSFGKVDAPANSKPYDDNFHVDRSRLGVHSEYDDKAPNEWGGKGKMVEVSNDIRLNAIGAMGDLRAKSSNRYTENPTSETGTGPCCIPTPYPPNAVNPMYRKRRGE